MPPPPLLVVLIERTHWSVLKFLFSVIQQAVTVKGFESWAASNRAIVYFFWNKLVFLFFDLFSTFYKTAYNVSVFSNVNQVLWLISYCYNLIVIGINNSKSVNWTSKQFGVNNILWFANIIIFTFSLCCTKFKLTIVESFTFLKIVSPTTEVHHQLFIYFDWYNI